MPGASENGVSALLWVEECRASTVEQCREARARIAGLLARAIGVRGDHSRQVGSLHILRGELEAGREAQQIEGIRVHRGL